MIQNNFKTVVVALILSGKAEEALLILSKQYDVSVPLLKVGLPKKHKVKACGCYTAKTQTISLQNSDTITNPFVILHEFYHHLRTKAVNRHHKGTEGNADKFALDFINIFKATLESIEQEPQ